MEEMNFSARAHDRIFKVSGTPDDLAGTQDIRPNDVLEAIQFRSLDWKLFSLESIGANILTSVMICGIRSPLLSRQKHKS